VAGAEAEGDRPAPEQREHTDPDAHANRCGPRPTGHEPLDHGCEEERRDQADEHVAGSACFDRERGEARAVARVDDRPPDAEPGGAGDDDRRKLEQAVREARLRIFEELGTDRAAAIIGFGPETDAPTTANALIYSSACAAEVSAVRINCMRTMPTLFADNSGVLEQDWNATSPMREGTAQTMDVSIARENANFMRLIDRCREADAANSEVNAFTIENDNPFIPFRSIL